MKLIFKAVDKLHAKQVNNKNAKDKARQFSCIPRIYASNKLLVKTGAFISGTVVKKCMDGCD